jgi:aquaporin Z
MGFRGIVIGGIVGLDIFFLAFIYGGSINPVLSLVIALLSGEMVEYLWLYWTVTVIGTSAIATTLGNNFRKCYCLDMPLENRTNNADRLISFY